MRRATPAPARASAGSLVAPHHHTLCGIIRRVPRPAGPSPTRRKSLSTAHAPVIAQAAGYVDYADEATGRLRPHAGANSMCQPPHVMPVRPSREGKRLHGDGQRPPRASISSMTDLLSCAGTGMALTRPLRLMIPNTTTLPAAPQPRLPFRAPPPPRGRFAQLQGAVEWLPQVLDLVTAGLQHTVESLWHRRTGLTAESLPRGRHPQHEQLQEAMCDAPRPAAESHTRVQLKRWLQAPLQTTIAQLVVPCAFAEGAPPHDQTIPNPVRFG